MTFPGSGAGSKIKVLIVDDSAVVRQALSEILQSDPQIEVIGTAQDPYAAADAIKRQAPDVITLDIEMPRMDGLTFLEKIMSQHPIPVIICSTLTVKGSDTALAALERGAVDVIAKPSLGARAFFEESRVVICDTVRAAGRARIAGHRKAQPMAVQPKLTADAILPSGAACRAMIQTTEKVVAVGASTGGTEALRTLLEMMPSDSPGIVIVQHMPEEFTARFAERLDRSCRITVKEAQQNDPVLRGQALIAPGNKHLLLKRSGARYMVDLREGPLVCRHRPSVDVLFRSAARYGGSNVVGVIMTGMGDDGARGMLEMKQAGSYNIAQDEATSVVFGMPAEAIKNGSVDRIAPLGEICGEVLKASRS